MRVAVEVWHIDLVDAPPPSASELDLLSAGERARHARYLVAEPARIFATTRIALRHLLALRLGQAPAAVRIEVDARGKPFAVDAPAAFFNVSHGSDCALVAFCDVAAVGVDVEKHTAVAMDGLIASVICAPAEISWLQANAAFSAEILTRLWTRKEAALKACGTGLISPVSKLDFGIPTATDGTVVSPELARIVWRDLQLKRGQSGAVALLSDRAAGIDLVSQSWPIHAAVQRSRC